MGITKYYLKPYINLKIKIALHRNRMEIYLIKYKRVEYILDDPYTTKKCP